MIEMLLSSDWIMDGDAEFLVLAAVFIAIAAIAFLVTRVVSNTVSMRMRVAEAAREGSPSHVMQHLSAFEQRQVRLRDSIEHYFETLQSGDEDSIARRLVRAGYFSRRAPLYFALIRILLAVGLFAAAFLVLTRLYPAMPALQVFFIGFILGGLGMVLPGIYLERLGRRQEEKYRRAFPDFMDTMIVCTDAGLSLEAAADRVSREFLQTHKVLGIHLCIMMLEVRAGKRLREALAGLADRLNIPEARSLSTLFRQSEELGSSLTQSLRVYSDEMRRMRMLRAEEKANTLPVKLIMPLAGFLFPVTMTIVVVPVLMSLVQTLIGLTPQ